MSIELRQPQNTGRERDHDGSAERAGAGTDKTRLLVGAVILVVAAVLIAWQFGLFSGRGNPASEAFDARGTVNETVDQSTGQATEERRWSPRMVDP